MLNMYTHIFYLYKIGCDLAGTRKWLYPKRHEATPHMGCPRASVAPGASVAAYGELFIFTTCN